jgi:hypothetical protein
MKRIINLTLKFALFFKTCKNFILNKLLNLKGQVINIRDYTNLNKLAKPMLLKSSAAFYEGYYFINGQCYFLFIILSLINKIQSLILKYEYKIMNNNCLNKNNFRQSFILPFILNYLDIKLPEGSETLTQYAFGVFTLSLVASLCFLNVFGYFLSLYLVQKYNIELKYPRFKKIINYYEKSSLIFIFIELIMGVFCMLFLMITAFIFLKKIIIIS